MQGGGQSCLVVVVVVVMVVVFVVMVVLVSLDHRNHKPRAAGRPGHLLPLQAGQHGGQGWLLGVRGRGQGGFGWRNAIACLRSHAFAVAVLQRVLVVAVRLALVR